MSTFLFPKHFVRGFVETELNPNGGRDLGRCANDSGVVGGRGAPCAAFTRYGLAGYLEFQPFGRKLGPAPLDRLFAFAEVRSGFGRNLPRNGASWSTERIMYEVVYGAGIILPAKLELRIWKHSNHWMGRYRRSLERGDLGPNGPYGMYAAIALRRNFGAWGRTVASQNVESAPRLLFPAGFARGYTEFEVNPPHNERDLGRCLSASGASGGRQAPCAAFSRYATSGYVEFQPLGYSLGGFPFHRLFAFAEPKIFYGSNVPGHSYSGSMAPILLEDHAGVGMDLPDHFELRWSFHRLYWLGRYRASVGDADLLRFLGGHGPYGAFSAVSLRWSFGGWGHRATSVALDR